MFRRPMSFSSIAPCCAALLLGLAAGSGQAQVLPNDGQEKLDGAFDKTQRAIVKDLRDGNVQPGKEQEKAIDLLAQWYTYRLTWSKIQTEANQVNRFMLELDNEFVSAQRKKAETQAFVTLLSKQLVLHAEEVLQNRDAIARLNAARVLHRVAQAGYEPVVDVLVKVVKDPAQNLGAKWWAFRGLQEAFAPDLKLPPVLLKDQNRQTEAVLALIAFINAPLPATVATPSDEIEGLRSLRREAIKALALTQYPAVSDAKTKTLGPTALVLLRIIRKDGFNVLPRWDEAVEAAIGIGWLQSKLYPVYQPDYAAHHMALAVVEMTKRYAVDRALQPPAERGWKLHSARLQEAMEAMQRDVARTSKDKEVVQYVNDVVKQSSDLLKLMSTGGTPNAGNLQDWLSNHPAKNDAVYKGVADSKVKPGDNAEP